MNSINNLKKIFFVLVMVLVMSSVFSTKAEAKVEKIKVTAPSGKTVRVARGKKVKLKTTVKKLKNKKVKYKSKNPRVAKVTAKGYVKGIKKGKTKIVVSSKSNPNIKKTIKVVVYKKAVKRIKLNKTKVNLKGGKQFKLVASVSPKKNVSKVLSYKSSNKNVATVTKNGIIKAVAAGIAKITVRATDGSKKKAICVVNVNGASDVNGKSDGNTDAKTEGKNVGIKSVKIRSAFSLDVELTGAKTLSYENFNVLCKRSNSKEFEDIFEIISLNTFDNIHYEVVIKENQMFECNSDVKVIIGNLNGVKEKVIHIDKWYGRKGNNYNGISKYAEGYNSLSRDFSYDVGDRFSYTEDFDEFVRADIKKFTVSELPKGLEATISEEFGFVYVGGTFAESANGFKVVITAIDMNDNEFTINWYFYIGDEDTLYVKSYDLTYLSYIPNDNYAMKGPSRFDAAICFSSNEFDMWKCTNFEAEGLPENTYISSQGYILIKEFSMPVKAGEYNITLSATTPLGQKFTTKYKLTLVDGIVVKGRLTDSSGKPLSNERIVFVRKFYSGPIESLEDTTTDENGYYQRRLVPGIYDVNSDFDNVYNSYNADLACDMTLNMKSLCFKVVFTNPILDKTAQLSDTGRTTYRKNSVFDTKGNKNEIIATWYEIEDGRYQFSLYTFVKKGTYNFGDGILRFERYKEPESYKVLTKQFTVNESGEVKLDLENIEL